MCIPYADGRFAITNIHIYDTEYNYKKGCTYKPKVQHVLTESVVIVSFNQNKCKYAVESRTEGWIAIWIPQECNLFSGRITYVKAM